MDSGLEQHKPLYLKHRPQSLDELVGQPTVWRTLSNSIEHSRLSHAYLFTGPRGTGKTSTARILAKSLNCQMGPTAQPCRECTPCLEIKEGISPAVFEIDAASNNSVDDARLLIERAPLAAIGGRFKIYIIDECHMLTKEAFNALLKTIEEPPPQVVFVLATTEEHKVPPTIVSRCQKLMFRLVSQEHLLEHLRSVARQEEIEIEEDALKVIARRSGGGLRDAIGLLDQASLLSSPGNPVGVNDLLLLLGALQEDVLIDLSRYVLERNGGEILRTIQQLLLEGREPAVIVTEIARHFLNLIKASYVHGNESLSSQDQGALIVGSGEYITRLADQAARFQPSELSQMLEQLDRLEQTCRRTTQPALALEMGLLSLCHRQDIHLLRDLSERLRNLESIIEGRAGEPIRAPAVSAGRAALASHKTAPPLPQSGGASQVEESGAPLEAEKVLSAEPTAAKAIEKADALAASIRPAPAEKATRPAEAVSDADGSVSNDQASSAAAAQLGEEPTAPEIDLDEFWEQLIEVLEKRSLPAYSLVSTHAFPLTVDAGEVSLGVLRDHLQKMVEGKSEHIKKGCEHILGRPVALRIKVVSQVPQRSQPRPRSSGQPPVSGSASPEQSADSPAEPEPAEPAQPAPERIKVADGQETELLREAYKLFEGPGSRQIG